MTIEAPGEFDAERLGKSFYKSFYDVGRLRIPAGFQAFSPFKAVRNYERNLPHWRQVGATYFLTFRLNDSLPRDVVEAYHLELDVMTRRMMLDREQNGGSMSETMADDWEAFQIRHARKMEKVMDEGHGACVLRHEPARQLVHEALLFFHSARYDMHGFALMPNHVHVVTRPLEAWQPEDLLHSWKLFTARRINELNGSNGQLWQHDTWNRIIRDENHWLRAMRYTLRNPERAGLTSATASVWASPDVLADSDSSVLREDLLLEEEPW